MSFLFVDYDQGAGGEYFCAQLSRSAECRTLKYLTYTTGRTKINDLFDQEFLTKFPRDIVKEPLSNLYEIVPTHRHTELATTRLKNIKSLRICNPVDEKMWAYLKHQQIKKVLLACLPSTEHYIGELRMLAREVGSEQWIRQAHITMDNASLIMLARGIELTEENKNTFINEVVGEKLTEPTYNYDLIVPYEDLFFSTARIEQQLLDVFGIQVADNWLAAYRRGYDAYLTQT
jgi:hypothetical protein